MLSRIAFFVVFAVVTGCGAPEGLDAIPSAPVGGGAPATAVDQFRNEGGYCAGATDCGPALSCNRLPGREDGICGTNCGTYDAPNPSACDATEQCVTSLEMFCLAKCTVDADCISGSVCSMTMAVCIPKIFTTSSELEPSQDAGTTTSPKASPEFVWNAQREAIADAISLDAREGTWILEWMRLAANTAGAVVTTGHMIQGSDMRWTYTPGGNELVFERSDNTPISVTVHELRGDYRVASFPVEGERLDVSFDWGPSDKHRVSYSFVSRDSVYGPIRRRQYSGQFTLQNGESVWLDVSSQYGSNHQALSTGALLMIDRRLTASITRDDLHVDIDLVSDEFWCTSCTNGVAAEYMDRRVSGTVRDAKLSTELSYRYKRVRQQSNSIPDFDWSGTAKRNGALVGSMVKSVPVANVVSLDFNLDGQTFTVEATSGR